MDADLYANEDVYFFTKDDDYRLLTLGSTHDFGLKRRTRKNIMASLCFGVGTSLLILLMLKSLTAGSLGSINKAHNFNGLICGWDSEVKKLPYLYFPISPTTGKNLKLQGNRGMCVSHCPSTADVAAAATIAVPEYSMVGDSRRQALASITYTIRSPVYSTTVVDGTYCYPDNPILRNEMTTIIRNNKQSTYFVRSLLSGVPAVFCVLVISVILGHVMTAIWKAKDATSVSWGAILTSFVIWACFGIRCLMSVSNAAVGILSLMLAVGCLWWYNRNYAYLTPLDPVVEVISGLCKCLPDHSGMNLMFQAVKIMISLVAVVTFLLIKTSKTSDPRIIPANLDPNGGLGVVPFERTSQTTITGPLSSYLEICMVLWVLETIGSMSKHMASYVASTLYFCNDNDRSLPKISNRVLADGYATSIMSCCGPLALFSIFRFLSRPIRVLCMAEKAYRFGPDVLPTGVCSTAVDYVHNGPFTEIAVADRDLGFAMYVSHTRLSKLDASCAAGLIGLAALVTWSCSLLLFTLGFVGIYMCLSWKDYGSITGGNPFPTALVAGVLSTYAGCIPLSTFETMIDSILYCNVIEGDFRQEAGSQASRIAPLCPDELRSVLLRLNSSPVE